MIEAPPALPFVDITKPMRMHFTHTDYPVEHAFLHGDSLYARGQGGTTYNRFSLTGEGVHPNNKLVNVPEPKRTFTKKIAWIENWGHVAAVVVTKAMEEMGVARYLKRYVPGKCIAITDVTFTEGDGEPPTY